jgi:hypothetical protein
MNDASSEFGRHLAAMRPRTTAVCEQCGASFVTYATGIVGRYCSHPCRQRAYPLAHAEQERERRRRSYRRRKRATVPAPAEPPD